MKYKSSSSGSRQDINPSFRSVNSKYTAIEPICMKMYKQVKNMEKNTFRYLTNSVGQLLNGFHSENLFAHRFDLLRIFVHNAIFCLFTKGCCDLHFSIRSAINNAWVVLIELLKSDNWTINIKLLSCCVSVLSLT